jgi:hypothetical protein
MSFKRWFKWWLRSFSAVMFFGSKKHKSDWQRKKEKQKRREYERRRHTMNYTVKERKKARSSNAILLDKLGTFFIASIAFFFIPLGLAKRTKRSKSIVVNAFSTPFIVPKDWFDIIGEIPTNIEEE